MTESFVTELNYTRLVNPLYQNFKVKPCCYIEATMESQMHKELLNLHAL